MAGRAPEPRMGMPPVALDEAEFKRRFRGQYVDPAFDGLQAELERVADAAWRGYSEHRKAPRTQKAGAGFADPDYDLADDWRAAHEAIGRARKEFEDPLNRPVFSS